jgi:ATP-binding protein involved in chromosome partitioning
MADQQMVLRALAEVKDPELHYDIVTLNMVRQVVIDGGHVAVDIALTVAGCPLHQKIERDVQQVLKNLPGVHDVTVTLAVMNDDERRAAFSRAWQKAQAKRGDTAPPQPSGAAPQFGVGLDTSWSPMLNPEHPTVIVGIASGKGGVGKSTVTANLAVALAELGHQVGVMDMDIYGFSQGRLFGAEGPARANAEQKVIPWNYHNVYLVSMSMFVPQNQAVVWRGPMLGKMMQQFFADVAWPTLQYLLIDLPPGTGDVALDIAQRVPKAKLVLVTTPQKMATEVAYRAADVARRAHQTIIGVIENMSYVPLANGERLEIFGHGGGEELAQTLDVPLLGQIPLEASVRDTSDRGVPVLLDAPQSVAAVTFQQIAQKLIAAAAV